MEINPHSLYWQIATTYINSKDKELRSEGNYYIDKDFALNCVKFVSCLKHTGGKLENKNFQFQDWQIKAIVDIWGTKHLKGELKDLRRYQKALLFMPKKNGKTELGATFHLIEFFMRGGLSKEQYSIASDETQAKIIHGAIETMIGSSDMRPLFDMDVPDKISLKDEISKITIKPPVIMKRVGDNEEYYQVIKALAKPHGDSADGYKATFFTSDEGHAQPSRELYDLISKGLASTEEPLEIHLSTAGKNKEGYFYREIYQYAVKVRRGVIKDDTFYQVMFELDQEEIDDLETKDPFYWKRREIWAKVNPNLGVSPTVSYMNSEIKKADFTEESLVMLKIKNLNIWQDKAKTWIKSRDFKKNQTPIDIEALKGKKCYGGLDLATTRDLAAFTLVFPESTEQGRGYDVITTGWIPIDFLRERVRIDKVPYESWLKMGLIKATSGNSIDHNFIKKEIIEVCEIFDVQAIGYDYHNSTQLVTDLVNYDSCFEDLLVRFPQTAPHFNSSIKEIEIATDKGLLNHGDNEVLNWQCQNVVLLEDSNGNRKMDKKKSIEKIDNMVAMAMAIGTCIADIEEQEEEFIYDDRGLIDI